MNIFLLCFVESLLFIDIETLMRLDVNYSICQKDEGGLIFFWNDEMWRRFAPSLKYYSFFIRQAAITSRWIQIFLVEWELWHIFQKRKKKREMEIIRWPKRLDLKWFSTFFLPFFRQYIFLYFRIKCPFRMIHCRGEPFWRNWKHILIASIVGTQLNCKIKLENRGDFAGI